MKNILLMLILLSSTVMSNMCNYHMKEGTKATNKVTMYIQAGRMDLAKTAAQNLQRHHVGEETECKDFVFDDIRASNKKVEEALVSMGLLKSSIY